MFVYIYLAGSLLYIWIAEFLRIRNDLDIADMYFGSVDRTRPDVHPDIAVIPWVIFVIAWPLPTIFYFICILIKLITSPGRLLAYFTRKKNDNT